MNRRESMDELRQDVRLAFRLFRRSPLFFAAAALTLAVGIGANGAVFSILQSTLLQPLPYRNPAELAMIWLTTASQSPSSRMSLRTRHALGVTEVLSLRRAAPNRLGEVAALIPEDSYDGPLDTTLGDRTERLNGAAVTPNFFELLGVRAAQGRLFGNADDASAAPLIVLSDALWHRDFGGDPTIVGRTITLTSGRGGRPRVSSTFTVAGILPGGFRFTYPDEIEAWVLTRWSDIAVHSPNAIGYMAVTRLRPGVTIAQARLRAADLPLGFERRMDEPPQDRSVFGLEPMHDWVVGEIRPSLQLLGAVAALLLLVTCVTVSNGLLARVSERQQELAVRAALGAGRSRLVRQLFTEGALLSIGGAVVGTVLAIALQPVLRTLLPASVPRVGEISVNAYVIAFGAAMAAVTTTLAAVAPAWGGTRVDAAAMLIRSGSAASPGRSAVRWRHGLVAAQAAIATALLVSASLLLTSLQHIGRVPLGFDGDNVLTVDLLLLDAKYVQTSAMSRFQEDMLARVRALPGVAEAAMTSAVPFRRVGCCFAIFRSGVQTHELANSRFVDAAYFKVFRISPVRGRVIRDSDRDGARPIVVISESYARFVFGAEDPIGQTIEGSRPMEVVGVVPDMHYVGREKDPAPAIYIPRAQEPRPVVSLVARTTASVGAAAVVPAIRRVIHDLDPALPAMNFTTIDQLVDTSVANRRFYTVATVAFATIALLLTIVGLVVVVARVVAERRRELAIRAALGATMNILARVAARDTMIAVGVGVVTGLAGAFAGSVALAQFLFHVTPRSPATYSGVAALVLSVAILSAWGPVRRFNRESLALMLKAD
ncbi:MAG: ADOP family duplicated permease [bacterium]